MVESLAGRLAVRHPAIWLLILILILILISGLRGPPKNPPGGQTHAPNLSNISALACIRRIRYLASNTPSEPWLAPVSVKRSSLSEPDRGESEQQQSTNTEPEFLSRLNDSGMVHHRNKAHRSGCT